MVEAGSIPETVSAVQAVNVGFSPPSRRPGSANFNVMSETRAAHRPSPILNAESDKLPVSLPVRLLRWWIPALLCVIGVVLLVVDNFDGFGVSAFAAFVGAGSSTWLINFLWRLGVSGDDDREREAKDRQYLAQHGHWPDEEPQSGATDSAA